MNLQRLIKTFQSGNGFDKLVFTKKINITAAEKGSCTAFFKVDQDTCNEEGFLASSYAAAVFDTISSLGVMTLHNKIHVSVNINLSFFKPAKLGEEIVVSSKVIKTGKSLLFLEGVLTSVDKGEIIAKGTHVKYVLDKNLFD